MIRNYLLIAWRQIIRNKQYTVISLLSLMLAITCSLLIGMYLRHEMSFDRFHKNADDLYRIAVQTSSGRTAAYAPLALSPQLKEDYAAVENFCRIWRYRRATPVVLPGEDESRYEENFGWADSTFFDVFDFKMISGDPNSALDQLNTVVVTRSTALRYFNTIDVIGKEITLKAELDIPFIITGVIEDFPSNSHFEFNFIGSIRTADKYFWGGGTAGNWLERWDNLFISAYIVLEDPSMVATLEQESTRMVNEHFELPTSTYALFFQPVTDIHLNSHLDVGEYKANGHWRNIYLFAAVALVLLLLGSANFINLVTARAGKRAREIGLRKTFGSKRIQLVRQFFLETGLMILLAYCMSLLLLDIAIEHYGNYLGNLSFSTLWSDPSLLTGQLALLLVLWMISSSYPAFFMSGFKPLIVMQGTSNKHFGSGLFRKSLIVLQFVISGTLLCSSIFIFRQVNFMNNVDPGFNQDMALIIPIHRDELIIPNFGILKKEFLSHPEINYVTAGSHLFYDTYTYQNAYTLEGQGEEQFRWERYTVEYDFPKAYGLELIAGRYMTEDIITDSSAVMINESAVKSWGITPEDAIGLRLNNATMSREGTVVGVLKDFHFKSLHEPIQPLVLMSAPEQIDFITVKVDPENFEATVAFMKTKWNEIVPAAVFDYQFQDGYHKEVYKAEQELNSLITGFTLIALLLSVLGLYGLTQFITSLRTKEIGVRKVLGATVRDIVILLNSYFIKLILLAALISIPVGWYLVDLWLSNFAYRVELELFYLLIPVMLLLSIGLLTVSWRTFISATVNPCDVLKNE